VTNSEAVQRTIDALRSADKLSEVDEARVAAALALAEAVDMDPGNASLWREYRAAEATLREAQHGSTTDELAGLLSSLSAQVGHASGPQPEDAGGTSGGSG
jgi:hypothetical protein